MLVRQTSLQSPRFQHPPEEYEADAELDHQGWGALWVPGLAGGFADGGSDRLIDACVAWGDVETIAERVRAHHDAGADHVALHVITDQPGLPLREWRDLAPLAR